MLTESPWAVTSAASPSFPPPASHEEALPTPEEAEAILQRMARALAPADADLLELAATLAQTDQQAAEEEAALQGADRAEILLRKAQARYRALVEQIPAVTFMAPLDGTTSELYVSPQIEALLGFTAREWLDNPILWYSQLHPDDQTRWQAEFARTLNAGEHFRSDYRFIARDGRIVWVHGEAKVVSDEQGRPLFLQGVAFDITERMEAEEKLQHTNVDLAQARDAALAASRSKSAFLANMSHELRTPLNAIIGFTEMLQEDARDAGQTTILPDLEKIHTSAKHLISLISNILDLSKIEAGKMQLFLESIDLEPMIREVAATIAPLVEANGNALVFDMPHDLGFVTADVTKLRQVLYNLLSNASKFTERGEITLTASRLRAPGGDRVRIDVADTGIGIAPEQAQKLFQSFTQGDESSTRKYGGTGLGLAISQRFCQLMGGNVTVQSELGLGSTFTIILPTEVVPVVLDVAAPAAEQRPAAAPPPHPPAPAQPAPTASRTEVEAPAPVLVIDDNPKAADLLRQSIVPSGAPVVIASSGAEGLRLALELRPRAVTIDLSLPDMDGWSLLAVLKSDPAFADVAVALHLLEDNLNRGYALGASDCLTRPMNSARLTAMLQKFKGAKQASHALVVDANPKSAEALCRRLGQEGWSATPASNSHAALKGVAALPLSLILLDLSAVKEAGVLEFIRVLRKTQAGRAIPVVLLMPEHIGDDDRKKLNACVQRMLQKAPFRREELLQEVGERAAGGGRAKPVSKPEAPAAASNGTAADPQALKQVQRQLEQALAERDAALARLGEAEAKAPDERVRQLEEEAERVRQQLREQQQSVELLRGEADDATAQLKELEQIRAERAAAVAYLERLKQTPESNGRRHAPAVVHESDPNPGRGEAAPGDAALSVVELRAERDAALAELRQLKQNPVMWTEFERAFSEMRRDVEEDWRLLENEADSLRELKVRMRLQEAELRTLKDVALEEIKRERAELIQERRQVARMQEAFKLEHEGRRDQVQRLRRSLGIPGKADK